MFCVFLCVPLLSSSLYLTLFSPASHSVPVSHSRFIAPPSCVKIDWNRNISEFCSFFLLKKKQGVEAVEKVKRLADFCWAIKIPWKFKRMLDLKWPESGSISIITRVQSTSKCATNVFVWSADSQFRPMMGRHESATTTKPHKVISS